MTKKLIEVAIPLDEINEESAREKSIRHGHPSTLHLWWSRKPLATTRAVIWASLVDDPSSHPEKFKTIWAQDEERERLFKIIKKLIKWENSKNKDVLKEAKEEILKSTNGTPPELLDPFTGGGSVPLEALRLGVKAHAHDLNPVAVIINKAMLEIPERFLKIVPVNPNDSQNSDSAYWQGYTGLAKDVEYYGNWLRNEAFKRVGKHYPKIKINKRTEADVIAWKWVRTVKCPNPACGCEMPLANSFELSKKRGNEASIKLKVKGKEIRYVVENCSATDDGTISRSGGGRCPACGATADFNYIRNEGKEHRFGNRLVAIVAEGDHGRVYLSATKEHEDAANVKRPEDVPHSDIPEKALGINIKAYGFNEHQDLFTNRQLTTLTTFCDLIAEVQEVVMQDAIKAGMSNDQTKLKDGGTGAKAYSEAIAVYLSFVIDKLADYHSSSCSWNASRDNIRNTFSMQSIQMVWDYVEGNPFCNSSGSFNNMLEWVVKCITQFPEGKTGEAIQFDAQSDCGLRNILVSTDPPYYDNIGYADISDYFYVWLRKNLKDIYPNLFRTIQTPKLEELVANHFRFESKNEASKYFEDGMVDACKQIYLYASDDYPVTIYYAYKQNDEDEDGSASTGWETMLNAVISAGFTITGTWPMRTERPSRTRDVSSNALASSIVLVCRKRSADASICTRRNFIAELKRELKPALEKLQSSNIAPVDLAQSAIGPGMAVFSKYAKIIEADGNEMSVRSALQIINQELDAYFNEQSDDLDAESRFCIDLYTQCLFNEIEFGRADVLARAKNTSIDSLKRKKIVFAERGKVRLLERDELQEKLSTDEKSIWLLTQHLTKTLSEGGWEASAKEISELKVPVSSIKALAYRLYSIAERKGLAEEARAYNDLVTAWGDIQESAKNIKMQTNSKNMAQLELDF